MKRLKRLREIGSGEARNLFKRFIDLARSVLHLIRGHRARAWWRTHRSTSLKDAETTRINVVRLTGRRKSCGQHIIPPPARDSMPFCCKTAAKSAVRRYGR